MHLKIVNASQGQFHEYENTKRKQHKVVVFWLKRTPI